MVPENEDNLRRWRQWWKVANQEQIITFYFLGLLTLIGLSVLLNSTLGIVENATDDISFTKDWAEGLGSQIGLWFEYSSTRSASRSSSRPTSALWTG
jgi:hypothetical protein